MTPLPRWSTVYGAVLYGLLGVFFLLPAVMSPMLFDAPGSADNALTVALLAGLVALPVTFLLGAGLLIVASLRRGRRLAIVAFALPVVALAVIVVAGLLLDRLCGGRLACR